MKFVSHNQRTERVLKGQYANIELTLPCQTQIIAQRDEADLLRAPGIMKAIESGQRVVMAPEIIGELSAEILGKVKLMSSPRQCGRVLEADEELVIDDENTVVCFKGVGATTFAVRARIDSWLERMGEIKEIDPNDEFLLARRALSKRRFHSLQDLGMLDVRAAYLEATINAEFNDLGARAQQSLAINKIEAMPDSDGRMMEIDYFKRIGSVHKDAMPGILTRAMRTNFRILDLVHLKLGNRNDTRQNVVDYLRGRNDETKSEYLLRVMRLMMESELMLILERYQIGNHHWPTHARNVSCEGEEIDLEAIKRSETLDLEANKSWAKVARALIYGVDPQIFIDERKVINEMVEEIIGKSVRGSNVPEAQKAAARKTFSKHWADSEDNLGGELLKLVSEVALST